MPQKRPVVLRFTDNGIFDVKNNLVYQSKDSSFSLRNRTLLLDAAGNTVLSVRRKAFTDDTWKSFRGESDSKKDLVFTAKVPSEPSEAGILDVTEKTADGTQHSYRVKLTIVGDQKEDELIISQCSDASTTVMAVMKTSNTSQGEETVLSVEPNFDPARVLAFVSIMILGMGSANTLATIGKSLDVLGKALEVVGEIASFAGK